MALKVFPRGKNSELVRFAFILLFVLLIPYSNLFAGTGRLSAPEPLKTTSSQKLPLAFIPILGSRNPEAYFQAPYMGGNVTFSKAGLTFSLPAAPPTTAKQNPTPERMAKPSEELAEDFSPVVEGLSRTLRLTFIDANTDVQLAGLQTGPTKINYLIGREPAQWKTGLASYENIEYSELYPGIDLRYESIDGSLKGTYTVEPGANPALIRWQYEGSEKIQLFRKTGDLQIRVSKDQLLTEHAPVAWQTIQGKRQYIDVRYQLYTDRSVGFRIGQYDRSYPLVIDPTLSYSSYLGGSGSDLGYAVDLDGQGNIYITGESTASDFPVGPGENPQVKGYSDAVVIKLTPDGKSILFITFIGGSARDVSWSMAVDDDGYATILGRTDSQDFPTVNPIQAEHGGGVEDIFVLRLSPDGGSLVYSTYLGGNKNERRFGIALDPEGNAYIAGWTESDDFPVLNAVQAQYGGGDQDAFAAKLSASGELLYSTFLGGTNTDAGYGIAIDLDGNAYVSGYTWSVDYPLESPFQPDNKGGGDLFITKLAPDGSQLLFSTFLGGKAYEVSYDMMVDNQDRLLITGKTSSVDFPVVNPIQAEHGGDEDVFVVRMTLDGSALDLSLYLGGNNKDKGYGIAVDAEDNIFVVGWVESLNWPTVDPIQANCAEANCEDTLLFKLSADGSTLIYSTYLGGTGEDYDGRDVVVDAEGNAWIVGFTESTDFPTVNPIQANSGGSRDIFLARIETESGSIPPPILPPPSVKWRLLMPQMQK